MLSIWKMTFDSLDYYMNLAAEDYYLAGGEPPGKFYGGGARALGLSGIVKREQLRALFQGVHPVTGKRLVQNAETSSRCPGHDLTFSAPKSVSIAWVFPEFRQKIQDIQQRAVQATLDYAEAHFTFSRVGSVRKDDWSVVRSKLVAAIFEHVTSRDLDCSLHDHVLTLNLGVDENGDTRTILSHPFYENRNLLGAIYRSNMAYLLRTETGFGCVRKGDSFEIRGFRRRLLREFSTRRKQIEREMKRKGESGGKAAAEATLNTRRTKKNVPPRSILLKRWQRKLMRQGFGPRSLRRLQDWTLSNPEKDLPRALAGAIANLSRRGKHFSEKELFFETLCEAVKYAIPFYMIEPAVKKHLQTDASIIHLKQEVDGMKRYATPEIIKEEQEMYDNVDALLARRGPRANPLVVERILAKYPHLTEEHARAVRHFTMGRGSLRIADGIAGTAKTSGVLKPCLEIWKKQGYRVIGAAPTGQAAHVLERATGIPTDTIHMRLCDFERKFGFTARQHLKQFGRAIRRKRTYRVKRPRPVKIDRNTILVVDESGMVNTRHMRMLAKRVKRGGGILVLIGDAGQIPPVEGSAPFQSLCNRASSAKLTRVLRQKEEWARQAVEHFSRGQNAEALQLFVDRGLITVRENINDALDALVEDWAEIGVHTPEKIVVLVATNEQSEKANILCQQRRIAAGQLDPSRHLRIYDDLKDGNESYRNEVHVGDRVVFTRNDRRLKVFNGFIGTVTAMQKLRRRITVRLDSGETVVVPIPKYRHLRLAYASTTHKYQGDANLHVAVLATGQNQFISYVQGSRGILTTRFYTTQYMLDLDDIENSPLVHQMGRKPDLRLAVDLLEADEPALKKPTPDKTERTRPPFGQSTDNGKPNIRQILATAEAHLPPRLTNPQQPVHSNRDHESSKRRLAAAALRKSIVEKRRRQRHAYALAQAEWERQRRQQEADQARLMAALTACLAPTQPNTQLATLGTELISRSVHQLALDTTASPTQPEVPLMVSAFADLFERPPVQEVHVSESINASEPISAETDALRNRQEEIHTSPAQTDEPLETHEPSRPRWNDDYDSGVNEYARRIAERDRQYATSSSSSLTYYSSYDTGSSLYSAYNEANRAYAAYQTYGAAQTWTTQQQTQTQVVPGSGPG